MSDFTTDSDDLKNKRLPLPWEMITQCHAHRHLIWQFTKRNIAQTHKGSVMGVFWLVLNPLLSLAIYSYVFGAIFNGRYKGIENQSPTDYPLGVFLSLTIFQLLAEVISQSPVTVVNSPNFVKRVVFPLEILSVAFVASALYKFAISMVLVTLGIIIFGNGISPSAIYFPIILLPVLFLSLGIAWLFSAIGVFMRDLQPFSTPLSLLLMYASAIFYSAKTAAEAQPGVWAILQYNPLIHIVEQARNAILWQLPIDWSGLAYSYAFSLATLYIGYACFQKLKHSFADAL